MSLLRYPLRLSLVLLLFIVVGVSVYHFTRPPKSIEISPTRADMIEAVYGIGTVKSKQTYQLKLSVAANVSKIAVKEGDWVKKGQLLAITDTPFYAPFEGVVTEVLVKQGETISPQTAILTLHNPKNCEIQVSLDQDAVFGVKPGQRVSLSFESRRQTPFYGRIRTVFSHNQQFWVYVDVDHLPADALPGMTVDAAIQIAKHTLVLQVPIAALQTHGVKIRRGRKTQLIPVIVGVMSGKMAQIVSGDIREGDSILIPK